MFFKNGTLQGSVTNAAFASGKTVLTLAGPISGFPNTTPLASNFAMGAPSLAGSISGNVGVAGATVSYTGTASGSVTADGNGNYKITGLADGSYTVTPSLAGATFTPISQNETISGHSDITLNFTALTGGGFPPPEYGYGYGHGRPQPAPTFYSGGWSFGRVPGGPVFGRK